MKLTCLALAACVAFAAAAQAPAPGVEAQALSGVGVLSQPTLLGEANQFFHKNAGPYAPGQNLIPLGNLRTVDFGGPYNNGVYNLSLLNVQEAEIQAAIAAKKNFTDIDVIRFATNVECLEGQFDTWGTFGHGFINNLQLGGPAPLGARAANLTEATRPFLEEIALNEQGHVLFTRQAGSADPCPLVDFDAGWNSFFAGVYGLPAGVTVAQRFGAPFDYSLDDATFVLCVLALDEIGATSTKGAIALTTNPVLANGIAGLATSATGQAAVERMLLWNIRTQIVAPFNETVLQVFARISSYRDSLDGPQLDDQGLVQADPRNIAVPDLFPNMIPTDIRGLTFSRTPQMHINILTNGSPNGVGGFFPNGLNGVITSPVGFNVTDPGTEDIPKYAISSGQESVAALGPIIGPLTGPTPDSVNGEFYLSEAITSIRDDGTPNGRGLLPPPAPGTYVIQGP